MSTFNNGVNDQFGQQHLHTPNYQFLSQVYGTQQARYDQGFSLVRNMYNSLLNKAVTSTDNQKFREDMFKKLSEQIKSISNADLANPTHVAQAESIFDPLTNDSELMYDMAVTSHLDKELQKAETYRNSTDPKIRSQYNDIAKEYLEYAKDDLRNAKRGDGSIRSAQKRDFVPFQDVFEHLQSVGEKSGLKIKREWTQNGYIYSATNGSQAIPSFTLWAKQAMGNKFDQQFAVTGKVMAERNIRGIMQTTGVTREEAQAKYGNSILDGVREQFNHELGEVKQAVDDRQRTIDRFKRVYPDGSKIPAKAQANFKVIKEEYDYYKAAQDNLNTQLADLTKDNGSAFIQNIPSYLANQYKSQQAKDWAKSKALSTEEMEIKADQVALTKWRIASSENIAAANRANQLAIAKMHEDGMNARFALKMKLDPNTPKENYMGAYTSPDQTLTGVDVYERKDKTLTDEMFLATFGAKGGLLEHHDPKNFGAYQNVLNKVHAIANGQNLNFSQQDMETLQKLGQSLRVNVVNPSNQAVASTMLSNLMTGTYDMFAKNVKFDQASGKALKNYKGYDANAMRMIELVHKQNQQREMINRQDEKLSDHITANLGRYQDKVKVVRYNRQGKPVYDLSGLSPAEKSELNGIMDQSFQDMSRISGSSYQFTKVDAPLFANALNPNTIRTIKIDGQDITNDYKNGEAGELIQTINRLPFSDIQKSFGEEMKVAYDPASELVKITMNLAANNPLKNFKRFKGGQTSEIEVTIPYNRLQGSQFERLRKHLKDNSPNFANLSVTSSTLFNNPHARVSSPDPRKNAGFGYTAGLVKGADGETYAEMNFNLYNPKSDKYEEHRELLRVDPSDIGSFSQIDELESKAWGIYSSMSEHDEDDNTQYED